MPKILVADDNTNIQKMVSLAFEERGIDVVAVGNGEAAVRRIPDMNPDLVLADIFMPVRNGYEVCEFVKKDERFSHVPVILLVGAFDPLDEKEARRVGADGVLKKPFVPPDPLIAMVISALEKNPKVAAEMAKAREVVPPEPEPMPAILEAPARAEVKRLPEFPEPSPEEAALVYGFGSGKRGKEAPSEDDMGPVSPHAEEAEAEDESDATTHDWRRNAMDFEVPEETSKSTAFALDDESPSAMFPSEKDVPPKHVRMKEHIPLVDTEAATRIAPVPSFVPPPRAAAPLPKLSDQLSGKAGAASGPDFAQPPAPPVVPPDDTHDSFLTATMLGTMPAAPPAALIEWRLSAPIAAAPISPTTVSASPVAPAPELRAPEPEAPAASVFTEAKRATESKEISAFGEEIPVAPVVEFETATSFATQGAHWMDAMTAALKDAHAEASHEAHPTPAVKMDLDAPESVTTPVALAPVVIPPVEPKSPTVSEEMAVSAEPIQAEADEFFANEDEGASDWLPVVSAETKKVPVAMDEPALEASGPVPVSHLAADPALIAEPDDSGPISKDPALVEPPPVHVTPEPLLVDEDAEPVSSRYDKQEEETAPAFAFEAPAPAAIEQDEIHAGADTEPIVDERIPTMPPPNREILAEIPFLSPPAEFLAPKAEEARPAEHDVDAVVQKVLEKLEPHLRDLFSQGVKPLVENILQNETAKKGR